MGEEEGEGADDDDEDSGGVMMGGWVEMDESMRKEEGR